MKVADYLSSCCRNYGLSPSSFLLDWAENLGRDQTDIFKKCGLAFVSLEFVSKQTRIQELSDKCCKDLIQDRKDPDCRKVSIKHAVKVVQFGGLHHQKGDVAALQKAIGSSYSFSSKILKAVDSNQVENLLKRRPRSDSVTAAGISDRFSCQS